MFWDNQVLWVAHKILANGGTQCRFAEERMPPRKTFELKPVNNRGGKFLSFHRLKTQASLPGQYTIHPALFIGARRI